MNALKKCMSKWTATKPVARCVALLLVVAMTILPSMAGILSMVPTPPSYTGAEGYDVIYDKSDKTETVVTPAGEMTLPYTEYAYTIKINADYLKEQLANRDLSKESVLDILKENLPATVYDMLLDRDPQAVKDMVSDYVKELIKEYLGVDTDATSSIVGAKTARSSETLPDDLAGILPPAGTQITPELLNQLKDLADKFIGEPGEGKPFTKEDVFEIVDVEKVAEKFEIQLPTVEIEDEGGNKVVVADKNAFLDDFLGGKHDEVILENKNNVTLEQIRDEAVDMDKVAELEINYVDLIIALLTDTAGNLVREAVDILARISEITMGSDKIPLYNQGKEMEAGGKFNLSALEQGLLASIPTLDELIALLNAGTVDTLYEMSFRVVMKKDGAPNDFNRYNFAFRIEIEGSKETRATIADYLDRVENYFSYDFEMAPVRGESGDVLGFDNSDRYNDYDANGNPISDGTFHLNIVLPEGLLNVVLKRIDENTLPEEIKAKLGSAAALDFSNEANHPAVIDAIIQNCTVIDLLRILKSKGENLDPELLAKFHLTPERVDKAVSYLDRAVAELDERGLLKYGNFDAIPLAEFYNSSKQLFTCAQVGIDGDLLVLADKLINRADDLPPYIRELLDRLENSDRFNDAADGVLDRIEGVDRLPDAVGDRLPGSADEAWDLVDDKADKLLDYAQRVLDRIARLGTVPDAIKDRLEGTVFSHNIYVNIDLEGIQKVTYKVGEKETVRFQEAGSKLDNTLDPNGAQWGWVEDGDATLNGITLVPDHDVSVTVRRMLTYFYAYEGAEKDVYKFVTYFTQNTLNALEKPTIKAGYSIKWNDSGIDGSKDVTLESIATADTYSKQVTYIIGDDEPKTKPIIFKVNKTIKATLLEYLGDFSKIGYTGLWWINDSGEWEQLTDLDFPTPDNSPLTVKYTYTAITYDKVFVNGERQEGMTYTFDQEILGDIVKELNEKLQEENPGATITWYHGDKCEGDPIEAGDKPTTPDELRLSYKIEEPETEPPVTEPETEPETVPETEPETVPETEPETVPETEPETVPETEPETEPETIDPTVDPYKTPEEAGVVGQSYDTFYVNGDMYFAEDGGAADKLNAINNTIKFWKGQKHDSMALRGWIGFSQEIAKFGYYIDGYYDVTWGDFTQATEAGVLAAGGEYATRFQVTADISDLTVGDHKVGFVLELADGTWVRMHKEITVVISDENEPVTEPPVTEPPVTEPVDTEPPVSEPETTPVDTEPVWDGYYELGIYDANGNYLGIVRIKDGDIILQNPDVIRITGEVEDKNPGFHVVWFMTLSSESARSGSPIRVLEDTRYVGGAKLSVELEEDIPDTVPDTVPDTETEPVPEKGGFPWWIIIIIVLVLIIAALLIYIFLIRRKKDEEETAPTDEEGEEPTEDGEAPLDEEGEESVDELEIRDEVSADMVDELMSNKDAEHFLLANGEKGGAGKMGIINIGQISENYQANDVVDLASLKEKGLVNDNVGRLKVLAAGVLDKPLVIKADAFSVQAIKMITLTGGQAIKLGDVPVQTLEDAPAADATVADAEAPAADEAEPETEAPEVAETVEEPVAEEPAAEAPVEEPAAETAEEPVAEEPVAEEPVSEEPVSEEKPAED